MKKLSLLFLALLVSTAVWAQNPKPFVIPELREWSGAEGVFSIGNSTQIIVDESQIKDLMPVAEAFAADVKEMFGISLRVKAGKTPAKGSVFFCMEKISTQNIEGYAIAAGNEVVKVMSNAKVGAFWATRTLLQIMEQSDKHSLPCGLMVDWPEYSLRGFMLDCGRKYFPIDFLRQYVKFMAYYKMNTFQVHLNDNGFKQFFNEDWLQTPSAFRLESETYPGLAAKDGHYTKREFVDLQVLAENNFVTIIPEIDAPAHTLAFVHYKPEIGSVEYGLDHLDLFKPETYEFMDGLWKEYIGGDNPVFRGKMVHIGTDEYSNRDKAVVEKFRYFTDHYIRYVESFGKKAVVWGALTHAKGETPVKVNNVLMSCWYNGYANPDSMMRLGYDVYSIPDGAVYIVPMAGYYYDYLNTNYLYNKWTPANIGNQTFEANDKVKGGMFAVWNDHPGNGVSTRDVHHRVWPAMQTLAVKMWDGRNATLPYDEFNAKRELLSEAPGVNLLGRLEEDKPFEIKSLKSGMKTGVNEVGYGYRVSFDIELPVAPPKATVLTRNADATFYLADPLMGKLGFSRDGYIFNFDYKVPVADKVSLAIESSNVDTKLFVNGKLYETLAVTYKVVKNGGGNSKMASLKTIQFPLAQVGTFNGKVTNLKAEKIK